MSLQAIILAGGKGSRLRDLHPDRPKALVPVAGQPFLHWQIEWLAGSGVTLVHLALGHMASVIVDWLREKSSAIPSASPSVYGMATVHGAVSVTCSVEPAALGTGGALKFVTPHIRTDPFLVVNGDTLLPGLDLAAFADFGARRACPLAIAVVRMPDASRYGTVEFDADGRIRGFREKASQSAGWVNGGVYLAGTGILARLSATTAVSLEANLFPKLAREGALGAFPCPPPLLDMGTPDGLAQMTAHLANHRHGSPAP